MKYRQLGKTGIVLLAIGFGCMRLPPENSSAIPMLHRARARVIGAMGTIGTVGALIFLAPFGRLADKHGRKKIIYLTRPFNYLALLIVVLAPAPEWLIVAAFVRSLNAVSSLMEITMEHELVPEEQRGRWGGFLSFFMGFVGIPGPILAGYLWNMIDPSLLLLTPIIADLPFYAILPTIPDTLHMVYERNGTSNTHPELTEENKITTVD